MEDVTKEEVFELIDENNYLANSDDWRSKLRRTATTNALKKTTTNAEIILGNDESLNNLVQYDVFENVTKLKRLPYWRSKDDTNYYWADIDTTHVISHIDRVYHVQFSRDVMDSVIEKEAYQNKFHPIKSLIESKQWDGVKRIETLFIDYLGAEDTHYNREVAKKWVMGAIARIYKPGIKYDTMVILYGKQGGGKSTLASRMGGQWYNQSINTFKGDEAYKKLQGSWICEIEELSAFQKSTIEDIKSFISAVVDIYRASYGKRTERHPRQSVFVGTTNNYEFLKDKTGNRRFLPVTTDKDKATKSPFDDLTPEFVQQMYAEAKVYFDKNPIDKALLLDKEASETALEMQEEHSEKDTLIGEIEDFLEQPLPSGYWSLSLHDKQILFNGVNGTNSDDHRFSFYNDGTLFSLYGSKPGQYVWRDKVCSKEVWKVMMGRDDQPQPHHLRKIDEALRNTRYCGIKKKKKRFGEGIGSQYGFEVDMAPYYKKLIGKNENTGTLER
ncbi:virulence-associated E family protein [Staphylococcus pettenkoferi]|uniref:virulence-associated E family protein n=1 Tax=Staphylococcus pettenkoferi TaxID=170573 RepID=UPI00227527F3|nr:virulence-associated E family protein [Staphylococcus pettenkoferi]MCY1607083.1 virulence-associated E family protein [Staphylococcus pettenkoferi]MDH9616260.1 virulence-associated E family protein [Staphylococcus pettenkoferi]